MEAFSTTLNNEEANWEKRSLAEPDPLPSQKRITKSADLRLVGETQETQSNLSWLVKWALAVLGIILSSVFVYLFLAIVF